jgi:hypothetical protein
VVLAAGYDVLYISRTAAKINENVGTTLLCDSHSRGTSNRKGQAIHSFDVQREPHLAAVAILIGHCSLVAGVLFVLLIVFWAFVIDIVAFLGAQSPKSEV